jgi:hypothetical protein
MEARRMTVFVLLLLALVSILTDVVAFRGGKFCLSIALACVGLLTARCDGLGILLTNYYFCLCGCGFFEMRVVIFALG